MNPVSAKCTYHGIKFMAIQRLSHIGIVVSNLENSVNFYREVFGFQVRARFETCGIQTDRLLELDNVDLTAVYLERDNTRIELMAYRNPNVITQTAPLPMNGTGMTHLSFRVSDLEDCISRVQEAGGSHIKHARFENPATGSTAVFVLDPDGVRIELLDSPGDPDRLPGSVD